jgi:hypothetical protein
VGGGGRACRWPCCLDLGLGGWSVWGRWEWRSRFGLGVACANLCSGFAETDPGSFNNTVAEKQVSSLRHFICVLPLC